jgi:hypothetical protein
VAPLSVADVNAWIRDATNEETLIVLLSEEDVEEAFSKLVV